MIKFIKIFNILLAAVLLVLLGFLLGGKYDLIIDTDNHVSIVEQSTNEQKLKKIFNLIDAQYIRAVDSDSMMDATLNYVLQGLDPHSVYLNSSKQHQISDISGEFQGLGIEYEMDDDTLIIIRSLEESPNSKYFIPGDKVLKINNIKVTGRGSDKISALLDSGDQFKLEILRNGNVQNFSVNKEIITLKSVPVAYELQNGIGYIKLAKFTQTAHSELKSALKSLQAKRVKSIILDLRYNGGGLLDEAEKIADEFLPNGQTIFYLQNEKDQQKEYHYANSGGIYENGKLIVLINEYSASASEVLSGALQDNKRATIIGRRSFGKALVQREIKLNDGSTVRITTAKYYTPSGRSIQKNYSDNEEYQNEVYSRYYSGELNQKKDGQSQSTETYKGGIIPDIFIGIPVYNFGSHFIEQNGFEIIHEVVIEDISSNISEYFSQNSEDFVQKYEPTRLYNKTFKSLKNNGIDVSHAQQDVLKNFIKAYAAKLVFGEYPYLKIWNPEDNMIQKSIELSR